MRQAARSMMAACVLSALILYLAFPNIFSLAGFSQTAWMFAIPLLDVLNRCDVRQRILIGVLFGATAYGLLTMWLWPLHAGGAFLFVLALSVQSVLFCAFCIRLSHPLLHAAYIASLWCVTEWVRAMVFGGFCWSIAYSQSFHPSMIQSAAWSGPYGTAFALMSVNYFLWQMWRNSRRRFMYLSMAFVIVAVVYVFGMNVLGTAGKPSRDLLIGAVQANIDPRRKASLEEFDATITEQMALTRQLPTKLDLAVWPETAFPADLLKDPVWYPRLKDLAAGLQAPLLLGVVPFSQGHNFNGAIVLNGTTPQLYHKQFLVPFSESVFTPGQQPGVLTIAQRPIGIMICSEVCYPSLTRALQQSGVQFKVVILNDGWFTHKTGILMHAQNTVWRAVESGSAIVSAGNTGWTGMVDANGRRTSGVALQTPGVCVLPVSTQRQRTFYAQYGDFFAALCLLFVIITLAYHTRNPRRL